MAGVGGAGSSGGGASSSAGSNSNNSGSAGKNDSNKSEKSSKSSGSDKSESKSSKGSDKGSFDRAMNDAQNKTDGGNDKSKTEANQQAQETGQSKSTSPSTHANEFSGLSSLNSHRGYGPDEQPAPRPDQKAKGEAKTIDVQGKLDTLDRQLTQQKAHEERSLMSSLVPDTNPDTCTPGHPTGQKPTPPASSVVYSGDRLAPESFKNGNYDFATEASARAAIADGLVTVAEDFFKDPAPDIAKSLKTISKGAKIVGPGAETTEAVLNAKPDEKVKAGVKGLLGSVDDLALSGGSGAIVGFFTGGLGGVGTAVTVGVTYDNSDADKLVDKGIHASVDAIEDAAESASEGTKDVMHKTNQVEQELKFGGGFQSLLSMF